MGIERYRGTLLLAPLFAKALERGVADCRNRGLRVYVFETWRSDERQKWLYAQGRTRPGDIVTNARNAMSGWHFFGLAADIIHETKLWDVRDSWWEEVAQVMKLHGLDWGGDWTHPDRPHFQWGTLKPSPSSRARALYRSGGVNAVWRAVGAI